jgi:hypothetical protein
LFRAAPVKRSRVANVLRTFTLLGNPAFRAEGQYRNGFLEAPDELFPDGRQTFRYTPERPTTGKVRVVGHSHAIVLSGDKLWCPVLGTEKNSMVLPRRIQLEDAQCRPVETGSQLGHGDRKNNFVDLDGAK